MGHQVFTGKRLPGFYLNPEDIVLIGLDTEDGEDHPLYDERVNLPVDEPLAKDIMLNGILQPIRVRKNGDAAEVVVGRQRVKAARLANRWLVEQGREPVQVPVIVQRATTEADFLGVNVSENEHRRGDDMIVKAAKAARLLSMGKTIEEVSIRFGVTTKAIRNWLAVLDTSSKVQKAVSRQVISATAAAKLARLPREEQNEALNELVANGDTSTKAAGERARGRTRAPNTSPPKATIRAVWELGADLDNAERRALGWVLGTEAPSGRIKRILRKMGIETT